MKRTMTLGIGIAALAALPAFAADLATRPVYKAPVAVPVAYNWSGCYIGGNVGGRWAESRDTVTTGVAPAVAPFAAVPGATATFGNDTSEGQFIGGGQIGCNWQAAGSNWVFGVEGDGNVGRVRQTRTLGGAPTLPFLAGDTFDFRTDWQASARGRIGYAWDRWMLYATGGASFTEVRTVANYIASAGVAAESFSDKKTIVGATVGGGLEYAISNNWSLGVEGRYTWYGRETFNAGPVTIGPPPLQFAPATQSLRLDTFEVTARLNYKFDWGAPVVARY
jgi:outer membrane immunogenic protein